MPIETPFKATAFGALDSDAFSDGAPYGGPKIRTPVGVGNWMVTKERALGTLVWPNHNSHGSERAIGDFAGHGWLQWRQIHPPIPIPKRPMSRTMEVRLRCGVSDSDKVFFQFATRAAPFRVPQSTEASASSASILKCEDAGGGNIALYSKTGVPTSRDGIEWMNLFVRGYATEQAMVTGTYGTPQSGTQAHGSPSQFHGWEKDALFYSGTATWAASGPNPGANIAAGGHYIAFTDASGNDIGVMPRDIIDSGPFSSGGGYIQWWPQLDPIELQRVRDGTGFAIYQLAQWRLVSLAMKSETVPT